jgi:hypothetical protein
MEQKIAQKLKGIDEMLFKVSKAGFLALPEEEKKTEIKHDKVITEFDLAKPKARLTKNQQNFKE